MFSGTPSRALPVILLTIIIARIYLRRERRIIGLKLEGGPCFSFRICLIMFANSSGGPYRRAFIVFQFL